MRQHSSGLAHRIVKLLEHVMSIRQILLASVGLLLSATLSAQVMIGSNLGPIPDGTGTGPGKYGAPRDVLFTSDRIATVQSIDVVFRANHTFVGDLKVTLISPLGIEHVLFERTGATTATSAGFSSNLVSTHAGYGFRDSSANNWWTLADVGNVDIPVSNARSVVAGPVTTPPPAVTSINSAFLNTPVNGTWILRFEDGWSGDIGDVVAATLTITTLTAASFRVTNLSDTNDGVCDSNCSLREAIAASSGLTLPGNQIVFLSPFFDSPRVIFLDSELAINRDLAIVGPGAHRLTISGAGRNRVFRMTGGARVTLGGMRIADGVGVDAGCVSAAGGTVVLHRVEISNCRASGGFGAGGVYQSSGGSLLLSESSVTGNIGLGTSTAGGVAVDGIARILRSTISGNLIVSIFLNTSGGIFSLFSNLTVTDSTITGNVVRGSSSAAGIGQDGSGVLTLVNSVVAGNVGGTTDIARFNTSTVVSGGYNAIGRIGSLSTSFNLPSDQFGIAVAPLDPVLSPLSYHGGTVPVHVPLPGSPLLDKGRSFRAADTRGVPRVDLAMPPAVDGNDADIGAVELSPVFVTNLNFDSAGSLRQALLDAPAAPAVSDIVFDPALTATPATLRFGTQLSVDRNVSIHGPGAQRLRLDGARQARVLAVQADRRVSLSGLTLADGNGVGAPSNAGGVLVVATGSHLSVRECVVSGGRNSSGAAIFNQSGAALWISRSTISGNSVGASLSQPVVDGAFDGVVHVDSSTFSGNRGNALRLGNSRGSLVRSTIHANAGASALDPGIGELLVMGSIIAGQRAGNDLGNGFYRSGGYNLIGNPGGITAFNQTGDQVPSFGTIDPRLSPLAVYSGQVPVHVPLQGSPAIDKGLGRIRDQRGLALFDLATVGAATGGDHSDVGATEAQAIIVNTPGDSGAGTLRAALLAANANGPGVDDVLIADFGRIDLTGALPTLTGHTNLIGVAANGGNAITRGVGAPDFSLLSATGPAQPNPPIQIGVSGITFTNGRATGASGGGAIDANFAELHLSEVEITGGVGVSDAAGGVSVFFADGVIQNSTFANNSGTNGGALFFEGRNNRLRVEQSTFSDNSATNFGGAINVSANADSGPAAQARLEVLSSTFGNNVAPLGGAILATGRNGNPDAVASVTVRNTMLSNNGATANAALFAPNFTSQGFNLSSIALPQLGQSSDLSPANAGLASLANNGGPVRTRALASANAGFDTGLSTGFVVDTRGLTRPLDLATISNGSGDASDIGAFEAQTAPVGPLAPNVAYSPNAGGNVAFTPFDVSTNRGFVAINSTGGIAPGSVRVNNCVASTGFTISNGPIDLLGTAGGAQITGSDVDLRCTRTASVQSGTLVCTETPDPGSAVQRTWNLSCPAADNLPPALTFNPGAGSTINYTSGGSASPIVVTPSGGIGSGAASTTTLSECAITNGGAAFPTTSVADLGFIGASTTAQNLNLPNCVRQGTAVSATLNCVERQATSTQVNRTWTLNCPAVVISEQIFGDGFE
jgi:CSLREA domain-containing protein